MSCKLLALVSFFANILGAAGGNQLSSLIGICFLQARSKDVQEHYHDYKNDSRDEKIFYRNDGASVALYGIKMSITRNQQGDSGFVIINTEVFGALKEFHNQNILEIEAGFLKYKIIHAYLEKVGGVIDLNNKKNIVLDKNTKVIDTPFFYCIKLQSGLYKPDKVLEDKANMGMKLVTIFSAAEFAALIDKYFVDLPAKTN